MAVTRNRLARLLGLAALAFALPACSAPMRPAAVDPVDLAPAAQGHGDQGELRTERPADSRPVPGVAKEEIDSQPPPLSAQAKPLIQQVDARLPDPLSVAKSATPALSGIEPGLPPWAAAEDGAKPADTATIFHERLNRDIDLSLKDYRNYYSLPNLALFGLGLGAAAPIANTSADWRIHTWIQTRAHAHGESMAEFWTYAGQLWVAVPVGLELAALCGKAPADYLDDGGLFEWSNRSLRAIAVGFPPVVASYFVLGASRPPHDWNWQPFNGTHGMSGHTFIGAVPFLTAASMTDNPWLKYPLILGSFMTGWARLYQDRHYFSQVGLGWWSAYLAVRTVNQTEAERRGVSFMPILMPGGAGVGAEVHY